MSVPYTLLPQIGQAARLGFILLSADETLEDEWAHWPKEAGIASFTTRIASGAEVSTASLSDMKDRLTAAAETLPQAVPFDVVGYACTSASCVIGSDAVADMIGAGCTTRHVTDPANALVTACHAQGLAKLAVLSPYTEEVNESMRAMLAEAGIETPVFETFNEPVETRVARIDPASSCEAALRLGQDTSVDAVFLSCTNLRTFGILDPIVEATGKPALSSNQVLFTDMLRLAKKKAEQ